MSASIQRDADVVATGCNDWTARVSDIRHEAAEVPAGLVSWFYDQEHFRYRVAELAPLVEEAATAGDRAARELLHHAADHLARAVARRLAFPGDFPLVLAGGAFRACPSGDRLRAGLELSRAWVTRLDAEPARGAVALALDLLLYMTGVLRHSFIDLRLRHTFRIARDASDARRTVVAELEHGLMGLAGRGGVIGGVPEGSALVWPDSSVSATIQPGWSRTLLGRWP